MGTVLSSVVPNQSILVTFDPNSSLSNWKQIKGDGGAVVRGRGGSHWVLQLPPTVNNMRNCKLTVGVNLSPCVPAMNWRLVQATESNLDRK